MTFWGRAYERLANDGTPGSFAQRMRSKRWGRLVEEFPALSTMRVLDLGGTAKSWQLCPQQPAHVTLLNVSSTDADLPPGFEQIQGDACRPPQSVLDREWDLVYSNSVIEHVGGYARRVEFSKMVTELAPADWVQTPYRYFPIEPHWLFPGFQWLPVWLRTTIAMRWPLYKWRTNDREITLRKVLEIELLSRTEYGALFPDARIVPERWCGLTKSYVAIRTHR